MGYIFDSYPLPLLRRLTVGAAIEKIFFDFYFPDFARNLSDVWIENILNFTLVILISKIFLFFQISSLYSSDFDFLIIGS